MVNSGRHPSNEELAEKAKAIFTQLPRYKDESPPEFSPGWIHRFKKRYGLLIRRQRRHASIQNPGEDIPYLVDTVSRLMNITPEVSPAAIRDTVQRVVGIEASLAVCARVRDEIVRRLDNGQPSPNQHPNVVHAPAGDPPLYTDEDPELALQNALRVLQQEEADAEAQAAAEREARDRSEHGLPRLGTIAGQAYAQQAAAAVNAISTPVSAARASVGPSASGATSSSQPRFIPPTPQPAGSAGSVTGEDLTLTPIPSGGPVSATERPVRCPYCLNQRMLRTIKEAVEHMSTHVIV
jgi:hypothetical protein